MTRRRRRPGLPTVPAPGSLTELELKILRLFADGVRDDLREVPDWTALVTSWTKRLGWLTYHTHRSDRSEPGFPDIVAVRTGPPRILLFVELKRSRPRTELAPAQIVWLDALSSAGMTAAVWRPEDARGILEYLISPESSPLPHRL